MKSIKVVSCSILILVSSSVFANWGSEFLTSNLLGDYTGKDQLGRPCMVSVFDSHNELQFVAASAATGVLIKSVHISIKGLQKKIEEDTDFRKREDKGFDPNYITTNYNIDHPELEQVEQTVGASWRDKVLSSIVVEQRKSNGFRIWDRVNVYCYGLEKESD